MKLEYCLLSWLTVLLLFFLIASYLGRSALSAFIFSQFVALIYLLIICKPFDVDDVANPTLSFIYSIIIWMWLITSSFSALYLAIIDKKKVNEKIV